MTNENDTEKQKAQRKLDDTVGVERLKWTKASTFDNFDKKRQLAAFEFMSSYDWHSGKSVVLHSPKTFGVGKTHLVCALLHKIIGMEDVATIRETGVMDGLTNKTTIVYQVIAKACPLYFTTETELMARIRATFVSDPKETEEQVFAQLKTCGLLVIDDIGKVKPRDLNFLQATYYRIIDGRYGNLLPIVLTTNLDTTQLEDHIGGACGDRLVQMCGKNFIKMTGKSYRGQG
jgi:DNA replication protein DnaC